MALLFVDGFDEYSTTAATFQNEILTTYANNNCGWVFVDFLNSAHLAVLASPARTNPSGNGKSLYLNNSAYLSMTIPASTEIIVGFAYYTASSSGNIIYLSSVLTTAYSAHVANGLRLVKNADASLSIVNNANSAVLGSSAAAVVGNSVWDYIEIRYKYGVSGEVQVRVNGSDVINLTGIDTRGSATGINFVSFRSIATAATNYIDDLYVCDTTGTTNNTFLGPVGIYTLTPSADAGVQMTPSAGANYSCVSEIPANSTNYVSATSLSLTDFYSASDLPAGVSPSSIAGVQVHARSVKIEHNNANLKLGVRSGGISSFGTTKVVPVSTWATNMSLFETQPNGSAWDKTAVDNMDIGILST